MAHPHYALLIDDDKSLQNAIIQGTINAAIHPVGVQEYLLGQRLIIACLNEPWVTKATIKQVRVCKLSEVSEDERRACGFAGRTKMKVRLREQFPDIHNDSLVTVLQWTDVWSPP